MIKTIKDSLSGFKPEYLFLAAIFSITILSGIALISSNVSADDSVVDEINITVPVSCSMTGTGMNTHNAEIINGTYTPDIGTTTLHAFCNDNNGFAIYAAGYTGNEIGETNSNKLVGTSATSNLAIDTGLATSAGNPDVSNWAMKLAITQDSGDTTSTNAFTIDSAPNTTGGADASFSQYHVVPSKYTKVAHKNASTDMTASTGGVKLTTTYAAYISTTQPADTYTGQVVYTLVHPSDHAKPIANPATLDTGKTVNSKLKSLAATVVNGEETTITPEFNPDGSYDQGNGSDKYIKSINVHLETPAPTGFTPTEKNTISTSDSKKPIYIVFDNTGDAGIMHFYTEGEQIVLSPDSSFMFYYFESLSEISDISDWDTSNVTDMSYMFTYAGYSATTFTLDLSSWNTASVTNMSSMFYYAGYSATTWSIGDLSSWNTSSVTNMYQMFLCAGRNAATWSIGDLSFWNTASVTNMSSMFYYAGYRAASFTLDLSSWNTASVTDMYRMFYYAGSSATTWSVGDLSSWNTASVTNMSSMFYYAGYRAASFTLDLSSWNAASVTNMSSMFYYAGYRATTFTLDLSSWNTASVTDMYQMFYYAGHSATTWSIGDLSSWNTAKVKTMSQMFYGAGSSATTFTLDLSSWNTTSVTSMYRMFLYAGRSATTFTLDLSSWNTASVTDMYQMFSYAGESATTWSVTISRTNDGTTTGPITNTTSILYGKTTSTYVAPPSGKSFTLAQP